MQEYHEPEGENLSDPLTNLDDEGISERFLILLRRKAITQADLARAVSVDPAYICRVLHGQQIPPRHMRVRIAKELDIDSGLLWPIEEARHG